MYENKSVMKIKYVSIADFIVSSTSSGLKSRSMTKKITRPVLLELENYIVTFDFWVSSSITWLLDQKISFTCVFM